jgi:hypothetical protein
MIKKLIPARQLTNKYLLSTFPFGACWALDAETGKPCAYTVSLALILQGITVSMYPQEIYKEFEPV